MASFLRESIFGISCESWVVSGEFLSNHRSYSSHECRAVKSSIRTKKACTDYVQKDGPGLISIRSTVLPVVQRYRRCYQVVVVCQHCPGAHQHHYIIQIACNIDPGTLGSTQAESTPRGRHTQSMPLKHPRICSTDGERRTFDRA